MTLKDKPNIVIGMAFSREKWVDKFRYRLEGALREFTKLKIAESLGHKDYWSNEVKTLVSTLERPFTEAVKTRGSWDRYLAAAEAFLDSHSEETKLTEAFNEYQACVGISKEERAQAAKWWRKNRPAAEDLSLEMLERFLGKKHLAGLLKELSE